MSSQWYYRVAGAELGPVSFNELADLVRTGVITADIPVCRQGTQAWTPASEVIGLFRAARLGAPPASDVVAETESIGTSPTAGAENAANLSAAIVDASEAAYSAEAPPWRERLSGPIIAIVACGLLLGIAAFVGWQVSQPEVPRYRNLPPVPPLQFFGFGPLSPLEYALCWIDVIAVAAGVVWYGAILIRRGQPRASH